MSEAKILFDINGDAYRATEFQVLTEDELNRELNEAKAETAKLEQAIAYSNKLQGTEEVTPSVEEEPAFEAQTPTEAVTTFPQATLNQPAPIENQVPVTDATVASDPATAPAPVAPIVLN